MDLSIEKPEGDGIAQGVHRPERACPEQDADDRRIEADGKDQKKENAE